MKYRFLSVLFFGITLMNGLSPAELNIPSAANLPPEFQMSEKDLTEMVNFLDGLSDKELKELEDLGRQVLTDMGYDAETLEPLDPNTPSLKDLYAQQQQKPAESAQEPVAPVLVVEPTVNTEELAEYLKKFLRHLHSLQHKATSPILAEKRLSRWTSELRDLNFYVTTIAYSEHLSRLQSKEYEPLLKHLKEFGSVLIHHEPLFIMEEPVYDVTDDSYEILGITSHATNEEIEEAYQKIKAKKSPDAIKAALTESGASEKDIQRAVKEARLTMSLITDAYEKLQDPKTREQIDRERLAHTTSSGTMAKGAQKSLDALLNEVSNAIYTQQLLNELEQFLKKYEPTKLEQKKALDKAEADRKKEQLEADKRVPKKTPGGPFEPGVRTSQEAAPAQNYPNYGYDYPYYPDYAGGSYDPYGGVPGQGGSGSGAGSDKKGGDAKGAKKSGGKDEKKDGKEGKDKDGKDEKKDGKSGNDKRDDKKKEEPTKLDKLFKSIKDSVDEFHKDFVKQQLGQSPADAIAQAKKEEEEIPKLVQRMQKFVTKITDVVDKPKKEVLAKYKKEWAEFLKKHERADVIAHYTQKAANAEATRNAKVKEFKMRTVPLTEDESTELAKAEAKKTFSDVFDKLKEITQKLKVESPQFASKKTV